MFTYSKYVIIGGRLCVGDDAGGGRGEVQGLSLRGPHTRARQSVTSAVAARVADAFLPRPLPLRSVQLRLTGIP